MERDGGRSCLPAINPHLQEIKRMNEPLTQLQQTTRKNVLECLELIASAEEQLEYQKNVPIADVPAELFYGWESDYQTCKNQDWFNGAFSVREIEILEEFDAILEEIATTLPSPIPPLDDFMKMTEWLALSNAAGKAIHSLNIYWQSQNRT